MALSKKDLTDLMKTAKKLGVSEFQSGDFKISFAPVAASTPAPVVEASQEMQGDLPPEPSPFGDLTDEQLLHWSSDSFDFFQTPTAAAETEE